MLFSASLVFDGIFRAQVVHWLLCCVVTCVIFDKRSQDPRSKMESHKSVRTSKEIKQQGECDYERVSFALINSAIMPLAVMDQL